LPMEFAGIGDFYNWFIGRKKLLKMP
jgi:hypothetical protein